MNFKIVGERIISSVHRWSEVGVEENLQATGTLSSIDVFRLRHLFLARWLVASVIASVP